MYCLLLDLPASAEKATVCVARTCNGHVTPNHHQQTQTVKKEHQNEDDHKDDDKAAEKKLTTWTNDGQAEEKIGADLSHLSEQRLRQTIQQIISETINMSSTSLENLARPARDKIERGGSADNVHQRIISGESNGPTLPFNLEHYFQPKSYQDLLATAVLNKVRVIWNL